MQYIVVDLEWNQPRSPRLAVPCGQNRRLEGEIVQIGAVLLNDDFEILDEVSIIVKPRFYPKMSKRIVELTGITDDVIAGGVPLEDAMELLRQTFESSPSAFFSWGMDDLRVLKQNFTMLDLDDSWLNPWYNLQLIYGLQAGVGKAQKALAAAMEAMELEMDRPAHDALNDAHFAALVMQKLDMAKGLAEYPSEGKRKKKPSQHRRRGHRGRKQKGAMPVPVKPAKPEPKTPPTEQN